MGTLISQAAVAQQHKKALKIIAKSLFSEMKKNGYDNRQIMSLSSELLGLVSSDMRTPKQPSVNA